MRPRLTLCGLALLACGAGSCRDAPATPASPSATAPVDADAGDDADAGCEDAPCRPTSCRAPAPGADASCGDGGASDCCESLLVPGGTFLRDYEGPDSEYHDDPSFPATVSAFYMDTFEITLGRFRAFIDAGMGHRANPPPVDAGAHPKIKGSGWTLAFTERLEKNKRALLDALAVSRLRVWSDVPEGRENLPMFGLTWYEAFAFCAWDGGRLPTEAEWNFAAAGGSEQRRFPWRDGIDRTRAVYDCHGLHDGGDCSIADVPPVGSRRKGDGKWGHADLIGSVGEWLLDSGASGRAILPCIDCAAIDDYPSRTARGGSFSTPEDWLTISVDETTPADSRVFDIGVRCVRDR